MAVLSIFPCAPAATPRATRANASRHHELAQGGAPADVSSGPDRLRTASRGPRPRPKSAARRSLGCHSTRGSMLSAVASHQFAATGWHRRQLDWCRTAGPREARGLGACGPEGTRSEGRHMGWRRGQEDALAAGRLEPLGAPSVARCRRMALACRPRPLAKAAQLAEARKGPSTGLPSSPFKATGGSSS